MTVITRPDPVRAADRTADRPRFRLRKRAHKIALIAHVLSSVGWFGIAVFVAFAAIGAFVTSDPTLSHALYRTIETVPWLSIPVGLVAIATGALLGIGTKYGVFKNWWVVAKIAIALVVVVTDAVIIASAARDAVAGGDADNALFGPTIAHVVILTIATVLSVFKPRGRTPWEKRRIASAEATE